MERRIADRNILDEVCLKFCRILEKHCAYIVVSGFVAISSGRTRGTEDIDVILEKLPYTTFEQLHLALMKAHFTCMQGDNPEELYTSYLTSHASLRYTYKDMMLPEMEVKFTLDELDLLQLQTRVKLPLTGLDLWFSSINMNIAFKEELLKSEKDMEDARHLRMVFPELVDEDELRTIKKMIRRLRL